MKQPPHKTTHFVSSKTQANALACKRVVFLPALGAKIVHLRNFKNIFEC